MSYLYNDTLRVYFWTMENKSEFRIRKDGPELIGHRGQERYSFDQTRIFIEDTGTISIWSPEGSRIMFRSENDLIDPSFWADGTLQGFAV